MLIDFRNAEGFGSEYSDGTPCHIEFKPLLKAALPELRAILAANARYTTGSIETLRSLKFSAKALDEWERTWFGCLVTTGSVPRRMTAWRAAAGLPRQ